MSVVAIAALAAGLFLGTKNNQSSQSNREQLQPQMKVATLLPSDLKTIPDVSFTDQHGNDFSKQDFLGKWQLLFFGYTHCPDVCPMTMAITDKVSDLVNKAENNDPLEVIFITVDPDRDTPEHLKKYVSFFNPEFIGLSSSDATLSALTQSLGVVYQRVENKERPESYLMDHSANLLLVDPKGRIVALFTSPHKSAEIAADITLIRNNTTSE